MISSQIRSKSDQALNFASAIGALVTSYSGAHPKIGSSEIEIFLKQNAF